MTIFKILIVYLVIINIVAFVTYAVDKYKAKHHLWRVPEVTLILLAFVGGALGAFLGMEILRHKTQHWKFKILVPLALVLWIIGLCYFFAM